MCAREEAAATAAWLETPPGEPPAGTMLACLTRGNLLDVLQEGFNEVTVLLLPLLSSPPPRPAPPSQSREGILLSPHPLRDLTADRPQSLRGAKVVGAVWMDEPVEIRRAAGLPLS